MSRPFWEAYIHPCAPDQDCDSVVIGEAEDVWPTLLQDAEAGRLKRSYKAEKLADLKTYPVPDRVSLSKNRYFMDIVQTTKGCPFHCEFCSVYAFDGQKIRHRTVEQVIQDVEAISGTRSKYKKKQAIFFADDNIIAHKQFAR